MSPEERISRAEEELRLAKLELNRVEDPELTKIKSEFQKYNTADISIFNCGRGVKIIFGIYTHDGKYNNYYYNGALTLPALYNIGYHLINHDFDNSRNIVELTFAKNKTI